MTLNSKMPRLKTYKGKGLDTFLKQKEKKKKISADNFMTFFPSPKLNFLYKKRGG